VRVVTGEVEDGAADDEVEGVVGVGDGLDGFDTEVFRREMRGEGGDESAGLRDGFGTLIGAEDLVAFAEEVDEIAAGTASGVEDSHAGHDVAAKELVEEVDVDLAELLVEGGHGFKRMIQDGGTIFIRGEATNILMESGKTLSRGIVSRWLTVRMGSTYTGVSKSYVSCSDIDCRLGIAEI
jgi:hypothetical protein